MSNKLLLSYRDLSMLKDRALENGTEKKWMELALDWMEGAAEHISIAFHPEIGWAVKPEEYVALEEKYNELFHKYEKALEEGRSLYYERIRTRETMFGHRYGFSQKEMMAKAYPHIAESIKNDHD